MTGTTAAVLIDTQVRLTTAAKKAAMPAKTSILGYSTITVTPKSSYMDTAGKHTAG